MFELNDVYDVELSTGEYNVGAHAYNMLTGPLDHDDIIRLLAIAAKYKDSQE